MTEDTVLENTRHTGSATRRRLLFGAAGLVTFAGCSGPNDSRSGTPTKQSPEDGTSSTPDTTRTVESTQSTASTTTADALTSPVRLGGDISGWHGQSPAPIQNVTNPTLHLVAGRQYELVWENLDGLDHEMKIADQSGDDIEKSESAEDRGETVSMTFTARPAMVEYFCEYHPQSMRGDIVVNE